MSEPKWLGHEFAVASGRHKACCVRVPYKETTTFCGLYRDAHGPRPAEPAEPTKIQQAVDELERAKIVTQDTLDIRFGPLPSITTPAPLKDGEQSEVESLREQLKQAQHDSAEWSTIANHKSAEVARLREAGMHVKTIGDLMGNACYNIGRPSHVLNDIDRGILSKLARDWDEAEQNLRAALADPGKDK